jgi:CTP synthase
VPGGFGARGIPGMLEAIRHARESGTPFFGICLGMQCAVIEFARNVCGLREANSSEFDPATPDRVIYKLRELLGVEEMGGTMRLGAWPCRLQSGSRAAAAYAGLDINERHRHRYEVNRDYQARLEAGGMAVTGASPDQVYVEVVEIPAHPWFLGCQFHPEFKSRSLAPHPLFRDFVGAAWAQRAARQAKCSSSPVPA